MPVPHVSVAAGLVAAAAILILSITKFLLSTRRSDRFPPGPPTRLGLGNAHEIPPEKPFLKFEELSKQYGGIVGLKVGPGNLVLLSDPEIVHELFSKRGAIYSGRSFGVIPAQQVMMEHKGRHILNLQMGPYLKSWRANAISVFGPSGQKKTLPMQEATSATLVHKLLHTTPTETLQHLKHWALATPLLAISGQRLEDRNQAFIDRFFRAQHEWLDLLGPTNAPEVDMLPILQWLPKTIAKWKHEAEYVRSYMMDEYYSFLKTAKKVQARMKDQHSEGPINMMTKLLNDNESKEKTARLSDDDVAWFGGGLLDAAVDTTWGTIMGFVLYMGAYPEVQAKAVEEVTRVSPARAPKGDCVGQLVYLRACLLELMRLRPVAPTGLPHVLERDDEFDGYIIPKGTTLLANVWALSHRPEDFNDPEKFIPERFIDHPLGLSPGAPDKEGRRATYGFGAGHRICPGEHFAQKSALLAMAKMLWAYEIVPAGKLDVSVDGGFISGLVLSPKPFDVEFRLRDKAKGEAVVQDYEASQAALRELGL
jgi:cytochrome P450